MSRRQTEETKLKISKTLTGRRGFKQSIEMKLKISCARKGIKFSDEHCKKLSEWQKGRKLPIEHRKNISEGNKGKVISDEAKRKQSESISGEKSCHWKGGISFEPYSIDWTKILKKSIRERDGYTCKMCNKLYSKCVHHIDYNKKNCNPNNLITLCCKCHTKTNHRREYWIKYLKEVLDRYIPVHTWYIWLKSEAKCD